VIRGIWVPSQTSAQIAQYSSGNASALSVFVSAEGARAVAEGIVDHVLGADDGREEAFPPWTQGDPGLMADYIEGLIDDAAANDSSVKVGVDPSDGTEAIYDPDSGIIVILPRPGTAGTAFPADEEYFDKNFPGKPGRP